MKKMSKILVIASVLMLVFVPLTFAQTDTDTTGNTFGNLWNWLLTGGLALIAGLFPTAWKKIKGFTVKLTNIIMLVMKELGDIQSELAETKGAAKALLEHYQKAIEDDTLSKEEQDRFIELFKKLVDEMDDIPATFKQSISDIKTELQNW